MSLDKKWFKDASITVGIYADKCMLLKYYSIIFVLLVCFCNTLQAIG